MTCLAKILQVFPPETAHDIALWALKNGFGPAAKPDHPSLQVSVMGKTFSNPVGLAAGAEKKAEALRGWAKMGFGFVEAGTVTRHPRKGNPRPHIWRCGDGKSVINWMGLPGDGLAPFVNKLKSFSKTPERKKLVLGVSIGSPEGLLDDFRIISAACAPLADYITLNASCPNVAHENNDTEKQIKTVLQEAGRCPVLLKIGPTGDPEILKQMVGTAMDAGAAGIVATNTVPFDKKDLLRESCPSWPQYNSQPVGGYSGPALLEITCRMVSEIRHLLGKDAPIIGVGGIQSGEDALRVIKAGAQLLQIYTGLIYQGPALLNDIKSALIKSVNSRS